jgi:hypothetical protein
MDSTPTNLPAEDCRSVCVRVFNDRLSAETAASILDSNGIASCINTDDFGGLVQLMTLCGARLSVPAPDSERAVELLSVYFPETPAGKRNFCAPCNPPRARAHIIVVIGIWGLFGNVLIFHLEGLLSASTGLHDVRIKFIAFWWSALSIALITYTMFRSCKNYFIQRRRAAKDKD